MTLTRTASTSNKRSSASLGGQSSDSAHTKRPRKDSTSDPENKQASLLHSGIKPSGNLLFSPSLSIRKRGLGAIDVLSDALLLGIIGLLTAKDVVLLGSCSKALFAYCAHQPIWKDLFIRTANGKLESWAGSWRKTYLQEFTATGSPKEDGDQCMRPTPTIDCTGIFSDDLYQPYLCANTDVNRYFYPQNRRDAASRLNISRVEAESIADKFAVLSTEPFIVVNALKHFGWPAFCSVDSEGKPMWELSNLLQKYSGVSFRAEAFDCTLQIYCAYAENCPEDDAPLYLFDSRFVEKTGMGADYAPPSFLSEDLFQLMGDKRPDYRWLIVGPAKSGSTFHKDPNATSAWNAVITGSKGWVMFPPDLCPPGVYVSPDEAEVTSPLSLAEWFMSYFDAAWSEYGRRSGKMRVGVCRAGEIVYVPSGWWHLVVNLEPSVAVTQNFASEHEVSENAYNQSKFATNQNQPLFISNQNFLSSHFDLELRKKLTNVLRFMHDKPEQTSGWSDDIACADLYEIFCDVLRKERPEVLGDALAMLNKVTKKGNGEQQSMWDQVKKSAQPEGNEGFSFGFDMEGSDDEE
ncbi:unnamed protein product [Rhizoctonia solani]|uniref:JmjC domain-containing protein n=1 Tax=Rhizoctonia solani TaxID=456999 RepID=A0A8H3BK00_9AGAM|nr:unnamed protein product [Rhizoctonia solani]